MGWDPRQQDPTASTEARGCAGLEHRPSVRWLRSLTVPGRGRKCGKKKGIRKRQTLRKGVRIATKRVPLSLPIKHLSIDYTTKLRRRKDAQLCVGPLPVLRFVIRSKLIGAVRHEYVQDALSQLTNEDIKKGIILQVRLSDHQTVHRDFSDPLRSNLPLGT